MFFPSNGEKWLLFFPLIKCLCSSDISSSRPGSSINLSFSQIDFIRPIWCSNRRGYFNILVIWIKNLNIKNWFKVMSLFLSFEALFISVSSLIRTMELFLNLKWTYVYIDVQIQQMSNVAVKSLASCELFFAPWCLMFFPSPSTK